MSTSQLPSLGGSAMTALTGADGGRRALSEIKSARFNPIFLGRLLVSCLFVRQQLQEHLALLRICVSASSFR
jgi:hypothetical protein